MILLLEDKEEDEKWDQTVSIRYLEIHRGIDMYYQLPCPYIHHKEIEEGQHMQQDC